MSSNSRKAAIEAVNALREADAVASMEITKRSLEKTIEYGKITETDYVVSVVDSSLEALVTVYNIKANMSKKVNLKEFLKTLGGQS